MSHKKILPYLAGIVIAVFFGVSFLVTQIGLTEMPPMVLISWRFGLAAIILTLLRCLHIIRIDYRGKPVKGVILLAVFYPGIAFFFETVGLQYVSSSQAGILVSMMPIFVTVFGIIILKEHPDKVQLLFVLLSVIGVCVTIIFAKSNDDSGNLVGSILMLISVVGGALNNVLSRKYSRYFTSIEITYMMICMGAVIFTIIAIIQGIFERDILKAYMVPVTSLRMFLVVIELSVGTSIVAFFCMNYMLSELKAVSASVFFNLATVISIAAGILIMREKLFIYQIVGGILIIVSVWGANYYENSK